MTEWIPKAIELLKLPTKLVAVLFMASGFVVFSPDSWLVKLRLTSIDEKYGVFIGLVFLASATLLLLELLFLVSNIAKKMWFKRKRSQRAIRELDKIEAKELAVIREFYLQGQSILLLPVSHPIVAGLIEKGILKQVGGLGEQSIIGPLFSLKLDPSVKQLLTQERLMLPLEPTERDIQWVQENRPEFANELDRRRSLFYGW